MQFDNLADFVAMGGHGLYVWLAYFVTIGVFLLNLATVKSGYKKMLLQLRWQHSQSTQVQQESGSKPE